MSIPTSVYENGRWVTRYQDVHHVLAQNRNSDIVPIEKLAEAERPPNLGLLSRTVVSTPVIKWIIPARIRHHDKNDVLYISAAAVQIKEAHGDYTLHHVATKNDFDAPIRAARICGLQRELTKPDVNAIIRREEHWMDDVQQSHSAPTDLHLGKDTDLVKDEDLESLPDLEGTEADEADFLSTHAVPLRTRILSPHILVLALESGKLVFMYTVTGDAISPQIVTSQRPLWRGQRHSLQQLGRHIAVDPRSRAMAVAAAERYFYLYKLKPMEDLQKEVQKRPRIDPISSERAFEVDGNILKMEFLHPYPDEETIATLLIIVSNRGQTRLFWYEWDVSHPLSTPNVRRRSQLLLRDDRMPLLLIPMTKLTAFILVCENRITVYTNILTGNPSRYIHSLSHQPEPEENGASRRKPIWVQWARVMRSWTHRAQGDGIYLCREDGVVHFLTLKYDRPSLIDSNHQVGRLRTNIDTSFAVIDVGPHSSDLLAVGGDGSDGGLWQFDARAHAKKIASSPNWTPIVDMCATEVTVNRQEGFTSLSKGQVDDQRFISCVGKSMQGAISEFRYGIPATRILAISMSDLLDGGVLAIWAFRSFQEATFYVILSHPKQTYLVRIPMDDEDDNSDHVDVLEHSWALGLKERTLAARATSHGRLIQITERALWSTPLAAIDENLSENDPYFRIHHGFGAAQVISCYIELDGSIAITLIATRDEGRYFLNLAQVEQSYQSIGSLELASQPTAVGLKVFGSELYVFVGSSNQNFQIFKTRKSIGTNDILLVSEFLFQGEFSVCDSLAVSIPIEMVDNATGMLIACGLRNGTMSVFEFKIEKDRGSQIKVYDSASFGATPVEVHATISDPIRFIAQCQGQTFSVDCCSSMGSLHGLQIHRVYMIEDRDPEWHQDQFSAIAIVEDHEASIGKTGAVELVSVDRSHFHTAMLDHASGPRNVPRQVGIEGSPVRAVYSKRLHKLMILSNRVSILRPPRMFNGRAHMGKRTIHPVVSFIDPEASSDGNLDDGDIMDVDVEEDLHASPRKDKGRVARQDFWETLSHEPGERFLGITEWFPKLQGKEFHMLAVNTMIKAAHDRPMTGRLLLFNVQVLEGQIKLVIKKETSHRAPVYAVAAHPEKNSLVFHCGEDLCNLNLEASSTGPKTVFSVAARLRSPARHITIEVPYIYVSTARDSLTVFHDSDGVLEYCFGDQVARQSLHHINLHCRGRIIMGVDMGGSLTGFWQPPFPPRIDNSLSTMFEASLPQSIVRLREVRLPRWLREEGKSDDEVDDSDEMENEWLTGQRLLLGISTCGTVSQHRLLAPEQWPLLRFLQNLAETSSIICPLREGPSTQHLDPDRVSHPQARAINGDLLLRLVERGGSELLRSLLNRPPSSDVRFLDFDNVEDRWSRLRELYRQFSMIETGKSSGAESVDDSERDLESEIIKILRKLLLTAL